MELSPVHPGPASRELLLLQGNHRSSHIWDGIIEIGRLQFVWALITAMIERWRSETHTFHLSNDENTITLEDTEVLFGLPVDGIPVAYPHALRDYTGYQPAHEAIVADDVFGILFPNTSENLVSLRFLHHLERLDDLSGYGWGAAVLAYLYRQMCLACMGTQRDVVGFFTAAAGLGMGAVPAVPATSATDSSGCTTSTISPASLEFIWRPYNDVLIAGLPDYCFRGRAMWSSSIPLICLDIVEHHATERVLRQFGRPQLVPILPTWHMTHYQWDDRSRVDQTYLVWLEAQIEDWDQRYGFIPPYPPSDCLEGEHEYMGWYRSVTRLLVGNPLHRAGGYWLTPVLPAGTVMLQHTCEGAVVVHEFGHRVTDLATDTLRRDREYWRLGYEAAYVPPEEYNHGPQMASERGIRGRRV
ncbi:serine/threonine-protein phosphatase 7 long form homolog [Nicotiana tomentosiformis]|uniref:serine/threonine-protein phosphatase 7 long form homolog n=1 Tax=Nicotiana tomentosiformis TaxID=4098 RepID=UPI00388C6C08